MTGRRQLALWTTAALLAVSAHLPAANHPRIVGTPANRLAEEVLRSLVSSPMGKAAPPQPWEVVLIDDPRLNAFINGPGHITVTSGMATLFGAERGLWATVLAHEIGHFVVHQQFQAYLPGFQAELEKAYREASAAGEQHDAAPPVRLIPLGGGSRKAARAREYEADRAGLLLMAQAGYHPDFVILLEHLLHSFFGDEPQLTEFLSSHPRWAEREQRTQRDHDVALAIFEARWPDAAKSPGGPGPAFGAIGPITVGRVGEGNPQDLTLRVPVQVWKAGSRQVRVEAIFLDNGRPVQSTVPEYRAADGLLVLNINLAQPPSEPTEVTLKVPVAALATRSLKLKTEVFLIAGDQTLALGFKPFEMNGR